MKNWLLFFAIFITHSSIFSQDYIENLTFNDDFRDSERTLQYTPTDDGYITCNNGKNLYTRALYGGNTLWRLETSDRPIFAAYHKKDNRNINFSVVINGKTTRLDSLQNCTSKYRGGERIYTLTDTAIPNAKIIITAIAPQHNESAIFKFDSFNMPKGSYLIANCCATVNVKINRSGDMGADPPNCFAPDADKQPLSQCKIDISGKKSTKYIEYIDHALLADKQSIIKKKFDVANKQLAQRNSFLKINTPDAYINTLGTSLLEAADGIWDGLSYQHGAVGWRMPLAGWRGAYAGDFLGRHDRARTHFNAYAASQVDSVLPFYNHPTQDSKMALARAEKRWGTQMYSNGYICRSPNKNNNMHHYDMNLCYIDALLWHLQFTGDTAYAKEIWPVIKSSLEWEKRNYDPDDDGLYDAYCCIWASDALYYNSGAVTHSSAYNHRANLLAARIAQLVNDDATPYFKEAEKIKSAVNSQLWLDDKGVWAEFRDFMGNKHTHTHPALWTVYHAIDGDLASPQQAFEATRYIDGNIPHIPVKANNLTDDNYFTLSTTDWLPYAWSINNVAFAEVYNTALAYWQAGRNNEATKLMKSAMLDGMFIGNSPGNIGQISHYDAARGESYRDFADPVGVLSRALVQGLFGYNPNLLFNSITLKPGFPDDWNHASITHNDFCLEYTSQSDTKIINDLGENYARIDNYIFSLNSEIANKCDSLMLILPNRYESCEIICDNLPVKHTCNDSLTQYSTISVNLPTNSSPTLNIEVKWSGNKINRKIKPQVRYADIPSPLAVEPISGHYSTINIDSTLNASVTDIFKNRYLTPRSPYTTLQLPVQGIGEWCHPNDTAYICDTALRKANGCIFVDSIPFATPVEGKNIAFVSLYDNYPDSIKFNINDTAKGLALFMAGSTNHMQVYTENAVIRVNYTDGSCTDVSLVAPYNWAPIEQDYFVDQKAFDIPTLRQTRVALASGISGDRLGDKLGIDGVYGRRINGGAGQLLFIPTDPQNTISDVTLQAKANEVVIGVLAITKIN